MHILYPLLACTLLIISSTLLPAQPADIPSSRIGSVINARTRAYFGLFPDVEGFREAMVAGRAGGIDIVIAREGGRGDTTIALSDAAARELGRYVDAYESLFENDTIPIGWELLRGIARPGNPVIADPAVIVVRTRAGQTIRGAVIFADERTLVLGPDSLLRDHGGLLRNLEVLGPSEIDRISDDRGFLGRLLSNVDVRIGGNDTLYRDLILPTIINHRFYHAAPSPEVDRLVVRKKETLTPSEPSVTVREFDAARAPMPFHISLLGGGEIPMDPLHFRSSYRPTMLRQETTKTPGVAYWCVGAEYSVLEWLNLGAQFNSRGGPRADTTQDFEEYYGTVLEVFARGSIVRPKRLFSDAFSRLNLGIGLGVGMQWLTIDARLRPVSYNQYYNKFFREKRRATGAVVLLSGDYYFLRTFSLGLEMKLTFYPGLRIERRQMQNLAIPEIIVREYAAHDLDLSSATPLLSARFHF